MTGHAVAYIVLKCGKKWINCGLATGDFSDTADKKIGINGRFSAEKTSTGLSLQVIPHSGSKGEGAQSTHAAFAQQVGSLMGLCIWRITVRVDRYL